MGTSSSGIWNLSGTRSQIQEPHYLGASILTKSSGPRGLDVMGETHAEQADCFCVPLIAAGCGEKSVSKMTCVQGGPDLELGGV